MKEKGHIGDSRDIPSGDILIEETAGKHITHIRETVGFPSGDILIKGNLSDVWICVSTDKMSSCKHITHIRHTRYIPSIH